MATEPVAPKPVQVEIQTHPIGGQDRAFVIPASIHIGKGSTKVPSVRWENQTKGPIKFWFPNGDKFFKAPVGGFENPCPIAPGGDLILDVIDNPTDGQLHYHVYCEATKECAHGDSEPTAGCP